MNFNNLSSLLIACCIILASCGDDEPVTMSNPCEGIELFEETAIVNSSNYQVSDPDYSDRLMSIWQFAFDAVSADCSENYSFSFEFADRDPIYGGSYTTKMVSNATFLDPSQKEVLVIYKLDGGANTTILSGGIATVNDNNDGTQTITLDGVDENQDPMKAEVRFEFK